MHIIIYLKLGAFEPLIHIPSAAYMRRWIGSSLVQIMACRLYSTKPLSKPICFKIPLLLAVWARCYCCFVAHNLPRRPREQQCRRYCHLWRPESPVKTNHFVATGKLKYCMRNGERHMKICRILGNVTHSTHSEWVRVDRWAISTNIDLDWEIMPNI